MRPFLAGFCSELLKTAFEGSSPLPVPATGSPTTQRPTGAAGAPARPSGGSNPITGPVIGAGATGSMPKNDQWRPSPKYTPKPDATATDEPAKPKGGQRAKPTKGMPWKEVMRPAGSPGATEQKADPRSHQQQAWGALPKEKDKPLAGQGRWGVDAPRPREMGARMDRSQGGTTGKYTPGHEVSDKDWEKMQRSSHREPGMERQKQTRMGTPDPKQMQKDLHRGARAVTQQEQFLKDQPMEPMTPMGGGRQPGQFATAKDMFEKNKQGE